MWGIQSSSYVAIPAAAKHLSISTLQHCDFRSPTLVFLQFLWCCHSRHVRCEPTQETTIEQIPVHVNKQGNYGSMGNVFPNCQLINVIECHRHLINDNQSHKSHRHTRRTQLIKSKTSCPFIFMNGRVRMPASFIHLPAKRCPCLQPFLGKMWSPLNGVHVPR